ncbi:TonB-dependent receptor domain-containing protein [Sphingomonas sp. SUN039]|uniref:TonB-dependent receptor domain-containing protein n=1 Tax=Sphingomonas sp. SUN039 TaxID=2937787 RepID=UPI0021641687|nr:TonB-dependent receptor [Sphingomonas sp. SUN039]UVO53124.1 TonB-dependent receptor [Sphingomonas sp. SUN039]
MFSARRLGLTASTIPFVLFSLSGAAMAQTKPAPAPAADEPAPTEAEIVVTGSSLKGVAPVGSNLVTVDRGDIENLGANTVQQVLKSVPAIVGLNSPGQGGFGSFDGAGTNAPTIHSLGASASNSTLILLNGHRLPVGGANHVLADPNIVPPMMLERVEVLSDGASSVYGSDAVAGVINFITRRKVDGLELNVQKGFGKQYGTFNAGIVAGKTWDTGSVVFGYAYSNRSNLNAADRSFTAANQVARGGFNFADTNCTTATIVANGRTYYAPYTAGGASGVPYVSGSVANPIANQNGQCDLRQYWDIIPSEKRHNAMVSIHQDIGDRLRLTGDFIYSSRRNVQNISRGVASGTVYLSGAPAGASNNPFATAAFAAVNAAETAAGRGAITSATVNFSGDTLLGRGAQIIGVDETFYGRLDAEYDISDTWRFNVGGLIGRDKSSVETLGRLNPSGFQLALNGRATAVLNGISTTVSQALTATNAIDVFGGNGTQAGTLATLTDSRIYQVGDQTINNFYAKIDGDLFQLPGGPVKVAIGGEYSSYKINQDTVQPNGLGAASFNSLAYNLNYKRNVKSGYVELYLPVIGPEQNIPGIRKFDLNISGRVDSYSDVGSTTNPKIAANWEIVEGLRVRGNWARSFVAPALTSIGSNAQGRTGESGFTGGPAVTLPYALFPTAAQIPGCVATATSCSVGGATGINGIQINGGNGNLVPQKGKAWSIGVDLAPVQVPGLRIAVTYWHNELRGGITAPQIALVTNSAALSQYLTVYPTGATAAQIGALTATLPQTGTVLSPTYFIYSNQQQNVLNLNVSGIDLDASYRIQTENMGKFTLTAGFSRKTQFDQFFGATGATFSVLGVAGYNLTFPSLKYEGRYSVGWDYKGFDANVFVNHTGGYINWGNPANARINTNGLPTGGGDVVKAFVTVDAHLGYTFSDTGPFKSLQIYADANNLFDAAPPFYNTFTLNGAVGYDGTNANPIGRVITLGIRTKF